MPAVTYKAWIEQNIAAQLAVVKQERERMRAADALLNEYTAKMAAIGLHPLTRLEIGDRVAELRIMEERVVETHGNSESMRVLYEARFDDAEAA